jgi:hypothetical protein
LYGRQFLGNCLPAKSRSVSPALATTDAYVVWPYHHFLSDDKIYNMLELLHTFQLENHLLPHQSSGTSYLMTYIEMN